MSNKAPYGYRVVNGRLTKDDAEQAMIKCVRELRAEGLTTRAIVAILEKRGVFVAGGSSDQ